MKRYIRPILALYICITHTLTAFAGENGRDDLSLTWISNYDEAIRQAKVTGKPLLLSFRCVP